MQFEFFREFSKIIKVLLILFFVLGLTSARVSASEDSSQDSSEISQTRKELVKAYLDEFASGRFQAFYPQIYTALTNAFQKLPEDVFITLTDRDRPIIFVLAITSGIGRYANSTEFIMREFDPPTFQDGFYLVTLSDELDDAPTPAAVEGIIFHEMAHRYLEHLKEAEPSCEHEREANRLIKRWGFEKEYQKASEAFGSKKEGDSPCSDKEKKQEL
ncbi:MAG: hypothetical protein KAJ18_08485 [Candidatus Omnitrophica bacterium]|nr:hypothetical protein [Candidatus Omnitrophota bacterium]